MYSDINDQNYTLIHVDRHIHIYTYSRQIK